MCEEPHIAICMDVESIPWEGDEHVVITSLGPISVFVCGDQRKPALITYSDVALNYMSCFHGLFFCSDASSLLFHNFCVYHIDPPGLELGAAAIPSDKPILSTEDLADQIDEVLDHFGLGEVMCMGVLAGAYILALYALKYRDRVQGLILVSPFCRNPSWSEWLYNKIMVSLLYYYGMCSLVKDSLLRRYFSQHLHAASSESDVIRACDKLLEERQSENVMRLLQSIHKRKDLTSRLKKLKCRTLIFVGDLSPFRQESIHMSKEMDERYCALVEVQACGSLVTEEQPFSMLIPLEYFLMGYGLYRPVMCPPYCLLSPTSPLSPPCISPELLSPGSLGVKLKPIKTRAIEEL